VCTPPPRDGRATRPAIRAAPTLASGQLEENLECEGEGAAAVDEVARLAEIGLRVGQQQRLHIAEAKKEELLLPPAPHLRMLDREGGFVFGRDSLT
jgi:hypothetical protein